MRVRTTATTEAASGLSPSAICGRPRRSVGASADLVSTRMPSAIRSEAIAEIVEWLRPVVRAISVREGLPALRTAAIDHGAVALAQVVVANADRHASNSSPRPAGRTKLL